MVRVPVVVVLIAALAGASRADAPVQIAAVPDGPIKLVVADDATELRRTFRLVPRAVEEVKIDGVRLVGCVDGKGQSCAARVEPAGCAGGCTLTATAAGEVTIGVALPAPGTYTASLEVVYVKEEKTLPDNKVAVIKAVLATALEVTRPAAAVQPMKITVSGAAGAAADLVPGSPGRAIVQLRAQDDDGAARKLAQVVIAPLVLKAGTSTLSTDARVAVATTAGGKRVELPSGAPLELPAAGAELAVEVSGLADPGTYEGKLRLLAPGRIAQDVTFTITVRDGVLWATLMIALGAVLSYGVQWWVTQRRARLVQQAAIERLTARLVTLAGRDAITDRERRLIQALLAEADELLDQLGLGDAPPADQLARFTRRVELAGALGKASADVEALPLAARARPRAQLDGHALTLADRGADDARLKALEAELAVIASTGVRRAALGELLAALDGAIAQARQALSSVIRPRLTNEVEPQLAAARAALERDQLDDAAQKLAATRLGLARVQGAALGERLPEAPPDVFASDADGYRALRGELGAALQRLDATSDADEAVQLHDDTARRLARAVCEHTASWCRAKADQADGDLAPTLRSLAEDAMAMRSRPAAEALAATDQIRERVTALVGAQMRTLERASPRPGPLASIPSLARSAIAPLRRARPWLAIGDGVVLAAVTLLAVASGLKLLWVGNPTWGGWNDWLTALLWGAGLHAVGNDRFRGLLGLKTDLGKTT